jgi:hypothetical protein
LRILLVEAAQVSVRRHPQWRSQFFQLAMRCGRKIAKVTMSRKRGVHLYWMWRRGWDYAEMQLDRNGAGRSGCRSVLENVLTPPTLLEMGMLRHARGGASSRFASATKLLSKWCPDHNRTGCDNLLNISLRLVLSRWSVASIQCAAEPLDQNRELGLIHFYAELFCNRNKLVSFAKGKFVREV